MNGDYWRMLELNCLRCGRVTWHVQRIGREVINVCCDCGLSVKEGDLKKKYVILSAKSIESLEEQVNGLMENGYVFVGEIYQDRDGFYLREMVLDGCEYGEAVVV